MTPATARASLAVAAALAAALASPRCLAGDAQAGRLKAQACIPCHGALGLSTAPDAPHLAGQPQPYLAAQLRAFRSGARPHEVMAVMARMLSDTDIDNLSAWFASLRVQVEEPR